MGLFEKKKPKIKIEMKAYENGRELSAEELERRKKEREEQYKNHPNPKFHRTEKENQLSSEFYRRNYKEIKRREDMMTNAYAASGDGIDDKIKNLRNAYDIYLDFKNWCYTSEGGRLYFDDMWEHLHNSRNPDWSYGERILEELIELENHREELIAEENAYKIESVNLDNRLLALLRDNPGIKQTDVYKKFGSIVKSDIQEKLYFMAKSGEITREKSGNTYVIYYNGKNL